jgi:hypothetical protein
MELTSDWIQQVAEGYPRLILPDRDLEDLLLRSSGTLPSSYRLLPIDQQRAKKAMDDLVELWSTWRRDNTGFQSDPPRPTPELRVKARI